MQICWDQISVIWKRWGRLNWSWWICQIQIGGAPEMIIWICQPAMTRHKTEPSDSPPSNKLSHPSIMILFSLFDWKLNYVHFVISDEILWTSFLIYFWLKWVRLETGKLRTQIYCLAKLVKIFWCTLHTWCLAFLLPARWVRGQFLVVRTIAANFGSNWRCILNSTL